MFCFNHNKSIHLLGQNDVMQLITKKTGILNVADMKYNTTSANGDPYQYNLKLKHESTNHSRDILNHPQMTANGPNL